MTRMRDDEIEELAIFYSRMAELKRREGDEVVTITDNCCDRTAAILRALMEERRAFNELIREHRELTRELDVALNGDGAAPQASLCDIVSQVTDGRWKLERQIVPPRDGDG